MILKLLAIAINVSLISNIILAKFLGICPFMGVSKRQSTAFGMGMAVTFVLTLAVIITWLIYQFLLVPLKIEFLQTIAFILVIASLVQLVEIVLKKVSPDLYQALGIYLPLITTNCSILGTALLVVREKLGFWESVVYAIFTALGFTLVIVTFSAIREKLELRALPEVFRGVPIAFITAGIMALGFMGFAGLDKAIEKASASEPETAGIQAVETKLVSADNTPVAHTSRKCQTLRDIVRELNQKFSRDLTADLDNDTVTLYYKTIPNFPITVKLYGLGDSDVNLERIATGIRDELSELRLVFDDYEPDSQVNQLSGLKVGEEMSLSEPLYEVLHISMEVWKQSGGKFDPTVKPLVKLWRDFASENELPPEEDIKLTLAQVGLGDSFQFKDDMRVVKLKPAELDFGGIAKGYIADVIVSYLKSQGLGCALIDLGGDEAMYDISAEKEFKIGVADPENPDNIVAIIQLSAGDALGIATSGSYYRGYTVKGKRYSHIIDPHTGYPVDTDLLSATAIVSGIQYAGAYADAYATVLYMLGRDDAVKFIEKLNEQENAPKLEAVLVWKDGDQVKLGITAGLRGKVRVNRGQLVELYEN